MNSIDDFADLRPDVDPPTSQDLDRIWARAAGTDTGADGATDGADAAFVDIDTLHIGDHRRGEQRRRPLALVGAAAALLVGIGAIVVAVDTRSGQPGPTADTPTVPVANDVGGSRVALDPPPRWGIVADGWELVEYAVNDAPAAVTVVAGPEGIDRSWVAFTNNPGSGPDSSPAPTTIPGFSGTDQADQADQADPISGQPMSYDGANYWVNGAAVDDATAADVFRAVMAGTQLPEGFELVDDDTATRLFGGISYSFTGPDDQSIAIEVSGGGRPTYDFQRIEASDTAEFAEQRGVDDAVLAQFTEPTLLTRTGFWVSQISSNDRTTGPAPAIDSSDFAALVGLVQVIPEERWQASLPTDQAIPTPTTMPDDAVDPVLTPLEASSASLHIEYAVEGWTLDAAEAVSPSGDVGQQYHYRSDDGEMLDIFLYPGGEMGLAERLDELRRAFPIDETAEGGAKIARLSADPDTTFRLVHLLDYFDGEWTIEIESGPLADRTAFVDLARQVIIRHDDGRSVPAV